MASELDYVPIPDVLAKQIAETWKSSIKDGAGKALWN
jgi:phosphate transport system substrate-binding protein